MHKRAVEHRLAAVEGFRDPDPALEQYPTPADVAAHLLHVAAVRGDLADATVVDLGAGTGSLALAAALYEPARVVAVERDPAPLVTARHNERRVEPPVPVAWVRGDATRPPVRPRGPVTVVSNPPFGAQTTNEHADRRFLSAVAALAERVPVVSYTVHNDGSRGFVESFAADAGATVTDAYAVAFPVARQFEHHTDDRRTIQTQVFRTEW
ncbi:METTL5 family protein [Halobaculum sp. MBLA0143]|uniref:METTL5 family protein n=1 Tax=Halobaculum sp. MBLA0143 TaxID=3079933 RepID=UPI0035240594